MATTARQLGPGAALALRDAEKEIERLRLLVTEAVGVIRSAATTSRGPRADHLRQTARGIERRIV